MEQNQKVVLTGTCVCSSVEEGVGVMLLNLTQKLLKSATLTLIDTTRNYKTVVQRLAENTTTYTLQQSQNEKIEVHVKFTKKAAKRLCKNIRLTVTEDYGSKNVLYDQLITQFPTFVDGCQVNLLNYEADPIGLQLNRGYEFKITGEEVKERQQTETIEYKNSAVELFVNPTFLELLPNWAIIVGIVVIISVLVGIVGIIIHCVHSKKEERESNRIRGRVTVNHMSSKRSGAVGKVSLSMYSSGRQRGQMDKNMKGVYERFKMNEAML